MNRVTQALLSAARALAVLAALWPAQAVFAQQVDMPDEALRRAVEHALDKQEGEIIRPVEMLRLRQLNVTGQGVADLTGIEHATKLTELWVADNAISDLSPLEELTQLTCWRSTTTEFPTYRTCPIW